MGRPSKRQIQIKKLAQDKRRRSSDPTYVGDIEMDEDLGSESEIEVEVEPEIEVEVESEIEVEVESEIEVEVESKSDSESSSDSDLWEDVNINKVENFTIVHETSTKSRTSFYSVRTQQ